MTTTDHLRHQPETYSSVDSANQHARTAVNTNPRYIYFKQTHFTAGDEDQFETYRDKRNLNFSLPDSTYSFIDPRFCDLTELSVRNTFRYMFHKFKKGIFLQIRDGRVNVMLPFSKYKYTNDWHTDLTPNLDRFTDWNALFSCASRIEGHRFNPRRLNQFREYWYANNALLRCEYPIQEHDTGVAILSHMFQTLCAQRTIPDIEFFVNRRDYPLLTWDGTESYEAFYGNNTPLRSHNYSSYAPLLSMCTTDRHSDLPFPTTDEWSRVCQSKGIHFPNTRCQSITNPPTWDTKKPVAVFRGSSTGYGLTPDTNPRLKVALLSLDHPEVLDAGLTKWNARPRKCPGSPIVDTFATDLVEQIPLRPYLSLEQQSLYKYIVHIDGHVAAFRLSAELNTGSVLLKVDSPYQLWFSEDLIPYTHYIPVKSDLSDLLSQIEWCRTHDAECQQIATNARAFYQSHLHEDGMLDYLQRLLCQLRSASTAYTYSPSYFSFDDQVQRETSCLQRHFTPLYDVSHSPLLPDYPRSYDLFSGLEVFLSTCTDPLALFQREMEIHSTTKSHVTRVQFSSRSFVLKQHTTPREGVHEAFVGLSCINSLYAFLPHFSYTLGWFDKTLVTEYIDAETMFVWMQSERFTFAEYRDILLQVGLALHEAQQFCAFTHYDVCPWNILLLRYLTPQTIEYPTSGYTHTTHVIPILIDYGKSHVIVNNHHYGFVSPYQFSSIHDILSLLFSTLFCALQYHRLSTPDLQELFRLSRFFSGTTYTSHRHFEHVADLKRFLIHAKKYATLLETPKYELETKTPLDFVHYLADDLPRYTQLTLPMRFGSMHHVILSLWSTKTALDEWVVATSSYITSSHTPFQVDYIQTYLDHAFTTLSLSPESRPIREWEFPPFQVVPSFSRLTDEELERPERLHKTYAALSHLNNETVQRYHLYVFCRYKGLEVEWDDTLPLQLYVANRQFVLAHIQ